MLTRGNPLHSKYINKSIKGLLANVSEDGKVMNVSGGTAVMRDKEGYRGIPKAYIQGWGQGLALAFFSELLVSDDIEKDGALLEIILLGGKYNGSTERRIHTSG